MKNSGTVFLSLIFVLCLVGFIYNNDNYDQRLSLLEGSNDTLRAKLTELSYLVNPQRWQVDTVGNFRFCGVDYDLSDWYFRERLQDELWRLYDRQGWLFQQYQRLGRFRPMIEAALIEQELPKDLLYLYVWESGLDPRVKSWANAVGIPQFIKRTAGDFKLSVNSLYDERKDPQKSIKASVKYLKQLYVFFGDWLLAIASYNHGQTAVNNKLKTQQAVKFEELFLPMETFRYVFQIMAVRYVMELGVMGNMEWLVPHQPLPAFSCQDVRIKSAVSLIKLSEQFGVDFNTFRLLNPHLEARLAPGKYPINLPVKTGK